MVKGPCAPTCCVTVCDESGHPQPTVRVQKVACRPTVDDGKYPGQHSLCVCILAGVYVHNFACAHADVFICICLCRCGCIGLSQVPLGQC